MVFDDRVNQPWNGPDPNASQPDMSGTYHLSFHGQADIWSWPASIQNVSYDASTNTTTAGVVEPVGNPFLQLNFSNTMRNPGDPSGTGITDVRLIRPGYDPNTTQEFTNQYLAALKPFTTIRTIDATLTDYNYGPEWAGSPLDWSQRHLPTDAGVGPGGDGRVAGTSWEDLIALANATHTNLWINIPGPATDDYVTQLANLIKNGDTVDGIHYSGLDPSLKVYVEWSNEVWGGIAATYNYNVADIQQQVQGGNSVLTSDGTPPTYNPWTGPTLLRNDLLHTERIATDFNAVFNDPNHDRIRPVLAWQEGNLWAFPATFAWFQSNFGAPSQYLYGIGGANYYSPSDYSTVDNLLNSLSAAEQALNQQIKNTTTLANQYGLKNVAYEGGPGISNTGDAGQVGLAALRDPRMEKIVYQSYIDWFANGGDQANFYGSPYGIWGPQCPWPAAELGQANNPSASPKYAGLMDVINAALPQLADTGFESIQVGTGAWGSFQYDPTGSPWTFSGAAGVSGDGSGFTVGNLNAPEGPQVASSRGTAASARGRRLGRRHLQISFAPLSVATTRRAGRTSRCWSTGRTSAPTRPPGRRMPGTPPRRSRWRPAHTIEFRGLDSAGGDNTAFLDDIRINTAATPSISGSGFESPAVGSGSYRAFQYGPTGSPWTFSDAAGVSGNGSGFTSGNLNAPEGRQVAFLQRNGSLSQMISGWATGTYQISFAAAQRGNYQASRQDFQVLVDGQDVGTYTPIGTSYARYTTTAFTVAAGAHTIEFRGLDSAGGDNTAFLDDVHILLA